MFTNSFCLLLQTRMVLHPYLPIATGRRLQPPSFMSYYWKYATIPYLPATTARRLRPPSKHVAYPSASQAPSYDNLISEFTSIDPTIEIVETIYLTHHSIYKYPLTRFLWIHLFTIVLFILRSCLFMENSILHFNNSSTLFRFISHTFLEQNLTRIASTQW